MDTDKILQCVSEHWWIKEKEQKGSKFSEIEHLCKEKMQR